MALIIKCNDVILPAPTTLTTADEIIWSSNTGRSTVSAKMLGDVIAEKKTFSVGWQWLTSAERKIITDNLKSGFNPISFIFDNDLYLFILHVIVHCIHPFLIKRSG